MTFEKKDWISEIQNGIKTIEELDKFIHFPENEKQKLASVIEAHPMLVSKYYLSLIDPHDPEDPLMKMMVPSSEELDLSGDYDTSGELSNIKVKGLQHKYQQTALILPTNLCAGYCRYCFRKRLVGLPNEEVLENIDEIVDYISSHPKIDNVLVSGGDPLVLETETIATIIEKLSGLDQLKFIRIGSKVPVVLPQRIIEDDSLTRMLRQYSKPDRRIIIVTQFNHPRELTDSAVRCMDKLINANCMLSNQSTLLRGVNDTPEILAELMSKLTGIGNTPYYVFQCRPVKRVKHNFQLTLSESIDIVESAKTQLNGQAKRFRFVMSHKTGKIEILGKDNETIYFKYHQAKNPEICGTFFSTKVDAHTGWLKPEDLPAPN